jgi:hypothetical protein
MVTGLQSRDYDESLAGLGIRTFEERGQADMHMVYKIIHQIEGLKKGI